jgi:hydroxyacylglutathione hydrolase
MMAWRTSGGELSILPQWTVHDLSLALAQRPDLVVLDVRQPAEWTGGHIPDATFLTGAELTRRVGELPLNRPIATICGSGYRSSVAASLLKRQGCEEVYNVLGGMQAWEQGGLPIRREG